MAKQMTRIINGRRRIYEPLLSKLEIAAMIAIIVVFIGIGIIATFT